MHQPVTGHLEEYLHGGGPFPDVEEHLNKCVECREELDAMRAQSAMLRRALRAEVEPSGGFYARVMNRIESQAKTVRLEPVWGVDVRQASGVRVCYIPGAGGRRVHVVESA